MKKVYVLLFTLFVSTAALFAVAFAPSAEALPTNSGGDTAAFVRDATAAGFVHESGSTYSVLLAGQQVCDQMDAGYTPRQVMSRLYIDSHLTGAGAEQFVNIAASDLCPFHAVQGYDTSRRW